MPAQRTPSTSPAMRAFAGELTAWRQEARLTKAELARLLGYTPQYVGQVEDCKNRPSHRFAEDCDTYFKTNGTFVRLWEKLSDTRSAALLPPGFPEYLEREREADCLKIFSALLVHGLFQTPEVVHAITSGATDTETAAELADHRLERQERILNRENPPQIFLVLDEGALRRVIGNAEIHKAQLRHLLDLAERPGIMIQVVPVDRGYYPGLIGSLTLLGFEDGAQAAYTESSSNGILTDNPERIAMHVIRWDLIRGYALPTKESLSMITRMMEDL